MVLKKSSSPARAFRLALDIMEGFTDGDYPSHRFERGTNLCHLVRLTVIYMPLIIALHLAFAAWAIYALLVYPIMIFGAGGYFGFLGITTLATAAIVGVVILINRLRRERRRVHAPAPPAEKDTGPGWWEIAFTWLAARKEKICPPVRFSDNGEVTHA